MKSIFKRKPIEIEEEPIIKKPEGGRKMNKIIIAILTILIMFAVGYVVFDKGSEYLNNQRGDYFNAGAEYGVKYLAAQAAGCQPIPVDLGNETNPMIVSVILAECLQQGGNQ